MAKVIRSVVYLHKQESYHGTKHESAKERFDKENRDRIELPRHLGFRRAFECITNACCGD